MSGRLLEDLQVRSRKQSGLECLEEGSLCMTATL